MAIFFVTTAMRCFKADAQRRRRDIYVENPPKQFSSPVRGGIINRAAPQFARGAPSVAELRRRVSYSRFDDGLWQLVGERLLQFGIGKRPVHVCVNRPVFVNMGKLILSPIRMDSKSLIGGRLACFIKCRRMGERRPRAGGVARGET